MAEVLKFTFDGVDTVENRLLGIPEKVQAVLITKIDIFTALVQSRVQVNLTGTVLNQRTGKLVRSVQQTPAAQTAPGVVTGSVGTDPGDPAYIYGITHEKGGTGPYTITAKNGGALAFDGGGFSQPWGGLFSSSGIILRKSVIHPPAKQRPWFAPAVDETRQAIIDGMAEGVNEVLA